MSVAQSTTCQHVNTKKFGFDHKGRQRLRCKDCGATTSVGDGHYGRIGEAKELLIETLLAQGVSIRKVAAIAKVSAGTVENRRAARAAIEDLHEPEEVEGGCDYCGKIITTQKEIHRKKPRLKHAFCDQDCYIKFYLVTHENRLINYLERKLKYGQEKAKRHRNYR